MAMADPPDHEAALLDAMTRGTVAGELNDREEARDGMVVPSPDCKDRLEAGMVLDEVGEVEEEDSGDGRAAALMAVPSPTLPEEGNERLDRELRLQRAQHSREPEEHWQESVAKERLSKLETQLEEMACAAPPQIESHIRKMLDAALQHMDTTDHSFLENYLTQLVRSNAPVKEPIRVPGLHCADRLGPQEYLPLARLLKWPLKSFVQKEKRKTRYLFDIAAHQQSVLDLVSETLAEATANRRSSVVHGRDDAEEIETTTELEPSYFAVNVSDEGRIVSKIELIPQRNGPGYLVGEGHSASVCDQPHGPYYNAEGRSHLVARPPGRPFISDRGELNNYIQSVKKNDRLAASLTHKGLSIGSEPYPPFRVTGFYPSPRSGYTLGHQARPKP